MKAILSFHTGAIERAARGELPRRSTSSDRARLVYGLENKATKMTREELKDAWIRASKKVRNGEV